jgi:arylsulfatase A
VVLRKQWLSVWVLVVLLNGGLSLGLAGAAAAKSTERPNIVYILADDLGYGDVQCLNPQRGKIKTPHLDRLAAQGMTFTDAHSGSSVCTPTRYGLLTGRYAWRSRLQNGVLDGYVPPLIAADRLTAPGLLKQQGYHTACIGKWHLGFTIEGADKSGGAGKGKKKGGSEAMMGAPVGAVTHDGPLTRGFDTFYGFHHARMMRSVFENDRVTQLLEPVDMLPALARRASEHIAARAKTGQPFFLYLALSSPHTPILPAKEWQGKSGLGKYGDFVMQTDWAVGETLAALDRAGVADNTLVIFTSDNGCSPQAGTEALEAQGHFASAQYRGYKADIWEGGHRVPFFVRWPARVRAGTQSAQLLCHTDFMATCAALLGAKVPDTAAEDSISFLPALLGSDQGPLREAIVHHSISGKFAIRQGQWKLELCPGSGGWGKPGDSEATAQGQPDRQLYDLKADPAETKNVQGTHPEIVTRLTRLLERQVAEGRSTPGKKQANEGEIKLIKPEGPAPKD